jgi:hypothetical protein
MHEPILNTVSGLHVRYVTTIPCKLNLIVSLQITKKDVGRCSSHIPLISITGWKG